MGIYLIYVIEKTGMLDLNKSQPACSRRSKFNTKIQYHTIQYNTQVTIHVE